MSSMETEMLNATTEDLYRSAYLAAAIIEEIKGSADGRMTFGQFARRSMYGYSPDITGFYTHTDFSPNSDSDPNSYGTLTHLAGFGRAIGEIIVDELARQPDQVDVVDLIEIGGGNGQLMANMLSGAIATIKAGGLPYNVRPVMIDKTPQLLDRQRQALANDSSVREPGIADPKFIEGDIDEIFVQPARTGAVVSNELLDMLPFEVAIDIGERRPGLFFVRVDDDLIMPEFGYAPEQYSEDAQAALQAQPGKVAKSFQPGLTETMQQVTDMIESGLVLTTDYRIDYEPDVQVCRIGATIDNPLLELAYPGLFDISTVPDWRKIIQWAGESFGDDNVSFGSTEELLSKWSGYHGPLDLFPSDIVHRFSPAQRSLVENEFRAALNRYSSLVIKK